MGNSQTIELNGKLYDTITGKVISSVRNVAKETVKSAKKSVANPMNGTVLDGFVRRSMSLTPATRKKKRSQAMPTPAHNIHNKTQRAKTLMRKGLSKPLQKTPKPPHQSSIAPSAKKLSKPYTPTHLARQIRAQSIAKSPLIAKFGNIKYTDVLSPNKTTAQPPSPKSVSTTESVLQKPDNLSEKINSILAQSATHKAQKLKKEKSHHKFARKLKLSNKAFKIMSSAVVLALLVVFMVFNNAPGLYLKVAGTRAGISASYPSYAPSGFSYQNIVYSPGEVTIYFRSNTDDRSFQITQRVSSWNSESLLNNHVLGTNTRPVTFLDKGKTVYIYDNSNATWVDGGIWYQIEGNAPLTSDQLIKIARGL